jgi:hypothetical protein
MLSAGPSALAVDAAMISKTNETAKYREEKQSLDQVIMAPIELVNLKS